MNISSRHKELYSASQLKEAMRFKLNSLRKDIHPLTDPPQVFRIEIKAENQIILNWLSSQSIFPKVYWADRDGTFQMGGLGVADEVFQTSVDYEELFRSARNYLSKEHKNFRYYGGSAFDEDNIDGDWKDFGPCRFWVPRFELYNDSQGTVFVCNIVIKEKQNKVFGEIFKDLERIVFEPNDRLRVIPGKIKRSDFPDHSSWLKLIQGVLEDMDYLCKNTDDLVYLPGKIKKLVLARKTVLDIKGKIDPFYFLQEVEKKADHCFRFCFQPKESIAFLGSSPERLYQRQRSLIKTEAIAGTRPRGKNSAEDKNLHEELLSSLKDHREHEYVCEFLRCELRGLCSEFSETEKISLLGLKDSLHLCSKFAGVLKKDTSDDSILKSLHPTPAVGGYPQYQAPDLIRDYEPFRRGWYAGPVGYIGYDESEFAVAIRSCLVHQEKILLYAGAGIVKDSVPENEWKEIENKERPFLKILKS